MAYEIVTVASGVMDPLIGKLNALMGEEYGKFTGVRKQASFLEKELSAMKAVLHKLELVDELDPTAKDWVDHVRDMSYDMENCIDDFMHQFRADDAKAGFIEKITQFIKKFRQRLRIADRMEELKTLALEANDRRERYKIDDWKPASSSVVVDPRLRAIYQEADTLVGIDGQREEVVTQLMDTQKKLKVVSVVGFGGLGKTTLAKQVYDKIDSQFDCKAFFSVSQRPDMSELLNNLQYKLGMNNPVSSRPRKVDDIIKEIRNYLKEKRYLIVVDDVWDESAWYIIKCVFPEEGNGSRVIVTTRVEVVAGAACQNDREGIYKLEPLSEENSRMLLLNRVFGSEHGCPPQLEQVMTEILKKCHGLPLAIITIGSLLASQERSRKGWEGIRDSLGAHSATNPSLEEMKSILNLSYMHLPAYLRACFLYLGMYVEDYVISRDDLVRQWIAEGLVGNLQGQNMEDVGRSYFNELINRSMIQPWKTEYGEVFSCKVHDLMLDLILSKCDKDNFVSVAYNYEDMARLHASKYKVRRLSLSSMAGGGATYGPTITVNLSQVRSFTLLGKSMPPLVLFKYLRVLRIDQGRTMEDEDILDLTAISQLFQLRYLYVSGPKFVQLPAELQGLVYLETLHIDSELKSIPSDIVHLSRLSYLHIGYCNHGLLSEWIGNMKSLNSLRMPLGMRTGQREDLNGMNGIMGLGELTNLRDLTISLWCLEEPELDALVCSIGKLCNLKHLRILGFYPKIDIQMSSLSNPFQHIEKISVLVLNFPRVPIWMGGLHCLRVLDLRVEETSTGEVRLLGELPSLVNLRFCPSHIPKERAILGTGLFPVLEYFGFWSEEDAMAYLGFEAGAMPNLQTLSLQTRKWGGGTPVGMEHLLRLQKIHLCGVDSGDATIVSAFRNALSAHPNRRSIENFW
ncbi:hypothetical protein CFC21_014181 [Triticum aestivum]|uniref:Uncharacterized protein n=2 Tax=Triticum aestivum TaxID=4565 RepID=A0A3B6A2I0_WHEAT|nr:disease resistance protein RGA5-like [Triticum aestivum]XP_044452093.1 disease resistance protein RGA5-like [Triticum aestivum]XP_044452094.1 disease resistance protein RGA5-like [Triticum aestivum]KAF6998022.1 hypothetical protein CFC21_014181 [Triticum aestivum]